MSLPPVAWALAAWSGALLGACQIDLGPVAWISLAPLAVACHGRSGRQGAVLGFVSGAVSGSAFYGLLPYGTTLYVLMLVYCGLNMAVFGALSARISSRVGTWGRVFLPALAWTGLEYGRRFGPVSFPIMLGPTQPDLLPLWQIAAWTGGHGVSFVVALPSGLALAWFADRRPPVIPTSAVVMLVATVWGVGAARMAEPLPEEGAVRVAGVQPALDNWIFRVSPVSDRHDKSVRRSLLTLTEQALASGAKLVVWPETVIQRPIFRTPAVRDAVQALADRHGASILVGAVREGETARLHNSAVVFRPHSPAVWQDKVRLAGYSEARMTPGEERRALQTLAGKIGVMICLESVYPQDARRLVETGAEILVTTTDDAGFRKSPIAEFHVRRAALRSIETGRWGIHVSQAGPSSITDPHGRTVARLGFWEEGVVVAEVRRVGLKTPYQTTGDAFSWAVLAVLASLTRSTSGARVRAPQNSAT